MQIWHEALRQSSDENIKLHEQLHNTGTVPQEHNLQ